MPAGRNAVRYGTASRELSNQLARERPELVPWLLPLRIALDALATEPWLSLAPLPAAERDAATPALHGATVPLEPTVARGHVRAVVGAAFASAQRAQLDAIDAAALLESAVAQDDERLADI